MFYHCPACETSIHPDNENDPAPVKCPECGADLYPEEVVFQQMITEADVVAV